MDEKYIDENGEIYRPVTVLKRDNEIVKVLNPKEAGRSERFVKVKNGQKAKRRARKLSVPEAGFLMKIMMYADYQSNILVGDGERGKKNVPLNFTDLYDIAGVHHTTGKQLIQSLMKKNVLAIAEAEGIKKAMILNPDYGVNGKAALPAIIEMFRKTVDVESLLSIDKDIR